MVATANASGASARHRGEAPRIDSADENGLWVHPSACTHAGSFQCCEKRCLGVGAIGRPAVFHRGLELGLRQDHRDLFFKQPCRNSGSNHSCWRGWWCEVPAVEADIAVHHPPVTLEDVERVPSDEWPTQWVFPRRFTAQPYDLGGDVDLFARRQVGELFDEGVEEDDLGLVVRKSLSPSQDL